MRIGRGPGGPKGPTGTGNAGAVNKAGGAKFSGMVGQTAANGTEEANRVQSAMMQELAALAAELQSGKATKEEASRRFVGLVIKQKFGKNKGKGAQKMEEAVSDMVEADPQFVSRLQSQLKRIAGG
jgi:hypothetical protein